MNILFLCWEYPPNGSGIGRYVAEMSSSLSRAGHRVVVLASRAKGYPEKKEVSENHVVIRQFERGEIRSQRVADLTLRVASEYNIDCIEVADHWGEGATLLKRRDRPPVIVKMHYNDVLKTPRYAQAWYPWQRWMIDLACLRQWKSILAERYSLRHADLLLAPCNRIVEEAIKQKLPLAGEYAIVPNPIRCKEWENIESSVPTVLLVGRLDIGKGLPYIRDLVEKLGPSFPNFVLEIAGSDNYARGLGSVTEWFKKQLGAMQKYVRFLGVLRAEEMDQAYRRAWVVIVPSRWDTFPQVVLEAMSRKKAIVASHHGGMPEMLDGTKCIVADPASSSFAHAVEGFLESQELRLAAGQSAFEKASDVYSPDKVVSLYINRVVTGLEGSIIP